MQSRKLSIWSCQSCMSMSFKRILPRHYERR
nr:MAG TPA: hypothetical protein [Caudoviricetes sp.]